MHDGPLQAAAGLDAARVAAQPVHAKQVDVERVDVELVDAKRVGNEPLNAERAVEVWRVDLRLLGSDPLRLLNASERARAARIANPARRALWMRARGMLRALLGSYLEIPPAELEFVHGKHGKPALAGAAPHARGGPPSREPAVHFNLSHSGPLALYAFTAAAPVGVDLELIGTRERDEAALAERAFGAVAARHLRELDAPARQREFLRIWVRHEAALKCLGSGLIATARAGAGADEREALWIEDLEVGPGAAAALAVQGAPLQLRLREWPAPASPSAVV
jgi:4'-phosphopantetheinyl transferase